MWTVASSSEEARRSAERRSGQIRAMANFRLSLYEQQCPGMSRHEIGRMLEQSNRQRLDAVPDRKDVWLWE